MRGEDWLKTCIATIKTEHIPSPLVIPRQNHWENAFAEDIIKASQLDWFSRLRSGIVVFGKSPKNGSIGRTIHKSPADSVSKLADFADAEDILQIIFRLIPLSQIWHCSFEIKKEQNFQHYFATNTRA